MNCFVSAAGCVYEWSIVNSLLIFYSRMNVEVIMSNLGFAATHLLTKTLNDHIQSAALIVTSL